MNARPKVELVTNWGASLMSETGTLACCAGPAEHHPWCEIGRRLHRDPIPTNDHTRKLTSPLLQMLPDHIQAQYDNTGHCTTCQASILDDHQHDCPHTTGRARRTITVRNARRWL